MRILIGVDGSSFSRAAVRMVMLHFTDRETEVALLHVLEPKFMPDNAAVGRTSRQPPQEPERMRMAREILSRAEHEFEKARVPVHSLIEEGDARSLIIETAKRWKADLIVLGTHGRTGLTRFLLGSVAEAVAQHAPCSVLLAREKPAKRTDR
jgi:universal stress protein A